MIDVRVRQVTHPSMSGKITSSFERSEDATLLRAVADASQSDPRQERKWKAVSWQGSVEINWRNHCTLRASVE